MTPMLHVRKTVLGLTQGEMAAVAGTSQGTVSKWEAGELEPNREQLALIRAEIHHRGIEWDDRLFFDAPAAPDSEPSSPPTAPDSSREPERQPS